MARLTIISNSLLYCYGEYTITQYSASNQTKLDTSVILQVYGSGGGYEGIRGGVQVGGNYYNGSNQNINLAVPGTYTLYSRSDTFTHNDDGSFPSGIGLQFNSFSGGSYIYSSHINLNTVIPQIPRASGISVNPTTQDIGSNVTFSIDRKVASYTHNLTYNLNGSTGTIDTGVGTSKVWTLPASLYNILSSAESGTMTVTCTTKNGSTVIGTSTCTLTANVPTSIKPTASLGLSDVGDTPSAWGIWLKAKSKVRGVIGATPGTGASIIGYSGSANNQNFSSTPFTTDYLTMSGSHTVRATAKDSRQRTSAEATQTISIVDYWNPTISNFQVKRCDSDGTLNEQGTYAKAIITYSIAPCSNKNTRGLTVTQGGTTKTITLNAYSGTVESEVFSGMATTNSYAFSCSLSDYFTSTPQTFSLGTAKRAFSLKHNEEGAAFGEVAEDDGLTVAWDANFKGEIKQNGVKLIESGSNANGSWKKWSDGTMECTFDVTLGTTYTNMTTAYGAIFFCSTRYTWTFPVPFINTPTYVGATPYWGGIGGMPVNSKTPTYAKFWLWNGISYSGNTVTANMIAEGRWRE